MAFPVCAARRRRHDGGSEGSAMLSLRIEPLINLLCDQGMDARKKGRQQPGPWLGRWAHDKAHGSVPLNIACRMVANRTPPPSVRKVVTACVSPSAHPVQQQIRHELGQRFLRGGVGELTGEAFDDAHEGLAEPLGRDFRAEQACLLF